MILLPLLIAGAQASGLDAPVRQQPTVRSEIKNGFDTAATCDTYDIEASAVDPCIARIITSYRITHPSAAAFLTGVNLRKWMVGYRFVQVAAKLPDNYVARDSGRAGYLSAGQAELDVRDATRELGITVDDAFTAADVVPGNRPPSEFPRPN